MADSASCLFVTVDWRNLLREGDSTQLLLTLSKQGLTSLLFDHVQFLNLKPLLLRAYLSTMVAAPLWPSPTLDPIGESNGRELLGGVALSSVWVPALSLRCEASAGYFQTQYMRTKEALAQDPRFADRVPLRKLSLILELVQRWRRGHLMALAEFGMRNTGQILKVVFNPYLEYYWQDRLKVSADLFVGAAEFSSTPLFPPNPDEFVVRPEFEDTYIPISGSSHRQGVQNPLVRGTSYKQLAALTIRASLRPMLLLKKMRFFPMLYFRQSSHESSAGIAGELKISPTVACLAFCRFDDLPAKRPVFGFGLEVHA